MKAVFAILAASCLALPFCNNEEPKQDPAESSSNTYEGFDDYEEYLLAKANTPDPRFTPIRPEDATPLEVIVAPDPIGDGFPFVPVEWSEPFYSAKWMTFRWFDPNHILVHHFKKKPNYYEDEDRAFKHSIVNVDTGEVKAEFKRTMIDHGKQLFVHKENDDELYLINSNGIFVPTMPEGEHPYVRNKNFFFKLHNRRTEVWILAFEERPIGVDELEDPNRALEPFEKRVKQKRTRTIPHVYPWLDKSKPPPIPNSPIPFDGDDFDPKAEFEWTFLEDGHLELDEDYFVGRLHFNPDGSFWQVEDDSKPYPEGWRRIIGTPYIYKRGTQLTLNTDPICGDAPGGSVTTYGSKLVFRYDCGPSENDEPEYYVWRPDEGLQYLVLPGGDPLTSKTRGLSRSDWDFQHETRMIDHRKPNITERVTPLRYDTKTRSVIGKDYDCPGMDLSGSGNFVVYRCYAPSSRVSRGSKWFEISSWASEIRARVKATVVQAGFGRAIALKHRGGRDVLYHVRMKPGDKARPNPEAAFGPNAHP